MNKWVQFGATMTTASLFAATFVAAEPVHIIETPHREAPRQTLYNYVYNLDGSIAFEGSLDHLDWVINRLASEGNDNRFFKQIRNELIPHLKTTRGIATSTPDTVHDRSVELFASIFPRFFQSEEPQFGTIGSGDVAGWWDFQEGTGSTVADSIASKNGAITGATWTTGGPTNLPNMLDLVAASSHHIKVTNDYDLSDGTVCVWVNVDNFDITANLETVIVGFGDLGGEMDLMTTQRDGTDDFRGRSRIGGSDRDVDINSQSTGVLYHVCYGWKSSSTDDTVQIWKDGSSVTSSTANWGAITDINHNMYWGRRSDGSATKKYDGKIGQTILFNKLLTTTEVAAIYNSGAGCTYSSFNFSTNTCGGGSSTPTPVNSIIWFSSE